MILRGQTIHIVSQAIRYIEDNLNDKLELDIVANWNSQNGCNGFL